MPGFFYCTSPLLAIAALAVAVFSYSEPLTAADNRFADTTLAMALVNAATARTRVSVTYDAAYRAIDFPLGDIENNRGVCSDLVIRSYRSIGIDLQQRVHADMTRAFTDYPGRWGLHRPDPNIDHRRVPNLEHYLRRQGAGLLPDRHGQFSADSFKPGDVVTWRLPNGAPHIGIVHQARSTDGRRPLVVHNIGEGPVLDDSLFRYRIAGHYRYYSPTVSSEGKND